MPDRAGVLPDGHVQNNYESSVGPQIARSSCWTHCECRDNFPQYNPNRMSPTRTFFSALALLIACSVMARTGQVAERVEQLRGRGVDFKRVELLRPVVDQDALWREALTKGGVVQIDRAMTSALIKSRQEHLSLVVPFEGSSLPLDLARTEVGPEDLRVVAASGAVSIGLPGIHYRGMVRGVPGSWAAISIFEGEVMGLINNGQGQIVLGKFDKDQRGLHVVYRDRDLRGKPRFECGTADDGGAYHSSELQQTGGERTVRCVRYYWEVNHNVFLDKGNLSNTTNYITGLFNQSAILFDNDGIDVTLSELFIWDVPSPYTGPTSGSFLDQFGVHRTSFNGDMAHLVGYGGGGGVAWLNTICSSQTRLRMAYSGINSNYSNVPTYSWSTMVVTHEAGHNLGSRHTHACSWNGNGTNIDGCGPTANIDYSEGSCPIGPVPTGVGGTIMSYCHLVGGVGINLNLGFGPQPTAVIVNAVNNASCLTTCGTTCDAPGTLTVTNIFLTGALLGWTAIGVTNYDLQWRQVGSSTWNTVTGITGNSYQLNGLVQGTNYEFQVRSNCSGTSSGYSTVRTFTTPIPCPDTLEPNNSVATAALVTLPAQVTALIATNTDADYYRFTISATSTINLSLSGMPYDYDLRLLNSAGTQVASSTAGGTTAEFINYTNAAPGTYYAHVFGFSGVFDPNVCYSLFVSSFVTACAIPQGVAVNTITYNSANVTWTTAQSASSYDLRWKAVADVDWTTETGVTAPPYTLNGLMELTDYQVQVRAICGSAGGTQGGSTSEYGELIPFTTLETPCEVAPRIQVGISVWLDGPYDMVTGLMHDSLRTQGLLPMSEPYTALGYTVSGAASISGQLLATTGPGAPVDWVLLELRSPNAPFDIVETRAALIRRDGALMAPDGGQFIRFCTQGGMYRLAVRHRNHLGCMTAWPLSLGPLPTLFSMGSSTTFGEQAMRTTNGVSRMWAGNALNDGTILYTGGTNDRDAVLVAIGGSIPTNTVPGYRVEDVNLDGVVKYSGTNNDRDVILSTIGGIVPTNSVVEQLP